MMEHLKEHLKGKVVILGIGNTLRSDDGAGSILASRIKGKVPHIGKVPYIVYDGGMSPENYLGKIVKDKPDNIIIIDAVDFGGKPGEFRLLEGQDLKTINLFSTHNASLSLVINYLQNNLKVDIIVLIIQPKNITFGEKLSQAVKQSVEKLENLFYETANAER